MTIKTLKRQARTRALTLGHNLHPFTRCTARRRFRAVCENCQAEAIVDWTEIRGEAIELSCEGVRNRRLSRIAIATIHPRPY